MSQIGIERCSFFDSTDEDEREYSADEFAEYFRTFLSNGIFNAGTNLKAGCTGQTISTYIDAGYAWIEGYMYKVEGGILPLTHELPDIGKQRIDRIVLRLDKRLEARYVKAFIKKGVPGDSPLPTDLQRDENVFEISLAQVLIEPGKSYIEAYQITDERLNNDVCGLVSSKIQADTTEIFNQFQAYLNKKKVDWQNDFDAWMTELKSKINEEEFAEIHNEIEGLNSVVNGLESKVNGYTDDEVQKVKNSLNNYLPKTSYTATDVRGKLKSVDGHGSGIDADTIDGIHAANLVSTVRLSAQQLNNTCLASGIYTNDGNGLLNNDGQVVLPGWYHVFVSYHWDNNGYGGQIALPFSGNKDFNVYYRWGGGTTWSEWRRIDGVDTIDNMIYGSLL